MKHAKRVVLFGIDGAGTFFEQAHTPNMDRIFAQGAVSRRTLTEIPTISAECWGGMLHGVECGWHGLTNSVVSQTPYPTDSRYPSVFRVIREAMPECKLAAFCDWNPINYGIIEDGIDVYKFSDRDEKMVEPAVDYIKNNDFTFLFFQFDSVDGAGHRHGYGTAEHLEAIRRNDEYIGAIVAAIEARNWLDDTLILVEADHGGTPNYGFGGHHGGATDEEKFVSFYAAGCGIARGEVTDMLVRDTPAVILHALGISQPEAWTARVPEGLFADFCSAPRPVGIPPRGIIEKQEPLAESGGFMPAFEDLEPLLYLPFEYETEFPCNTKAHGKHYLVAGRIGMGMNFEDGALETDCPPLTGGYSVLFWVRPDEGMNHQTCTVTAVGSSCRQVDVEPGLSLEVGSSFVRAAMNGSLNGLACPLDMTCPGLGVGKWNHVVFTVDMAARQFGLSVNFGRLYHWGIPEGMTLPQGGRLFIGSDCHYEDCPRLAAVVDDLCVCRKVVDEDILARLKVYYQK